MGLLDDIRGLLTPKPAVVPNPFDRQANAAIPIMGASEILPNMVGRMTGSPIAEFAAGFISPSSWIKQPNKMKIFAGKGAKTADIQKLEKAQDMAKAGSPREAIWKETGWWQGPDKQWRFEIADDAAKQLKNAKDTGMHYLDQWISHPELQGAYPKMFNHEFAGIAGDGGILAMAKDKYGHGGSFTQNNLIVDGATKGAERKSATLHELQHAIQQREGWARGGSPDAMRSFLAPDPSLQPAYSQAELYDAYHRLAGEAEARLTQARMPMTMDERLTTPPWTMFDVPESQQIVRFGDGPAMSTGRPRNHLGQEIPPTPYELAHAEAQRVAALPVEQGGLGLPPDNTAMDRARAMGFDTDAYHGTNRDVMTGFNIDMLGENTGAKSAKSAIFAAGDFATPNSYVFAPNEAAFDYFRILNKQEIEKGLDQFELVNARRNEIETALKKHPAHRKVSFFGVNKSNSPTQAEKDDYKNLLRLLDAQYMSDGFMQKSATWTRNNEIFDADIQTNKWIPISSVEEPSPNIMPLRIKAGDLPQHMQHDPEYRDSTYADIIKYATDNGANGVVIKNTRDGSTIPTDIYAITDPSRFRSRFAAFNPMKKDSSDLLAGIAPWTMPIGATLLGGSFLLPPEEY